MTGDAFNEGVGHGGIIVNLVGGSAQQGVVIDPWTPNPETIKILQPNQYGTTIKKAGRVSNLSATGTAQLPTDGNGNAIPIEAGQYFQDPITNTWWWVSKAGQSYQSGQFWKQELECEERLN